MRFKIDRASLKVGSKFKAFALFYFVFEGNFPSTSPGGLYLEGRFNGGFFALPVWGSYIWRGLFLEFDSMLWLNFIGGLSSNSRLCLSASPPSKTFKIQ